MDWTGMLRPLEACCPCRPSCCGLPPSHWWHPDHECRYVPDDLHKNGQLSTMCGRIGWLVAFSVP